MKYIFLILLMTVATSAHARGSRRIQPIEHPTCRMFLVNGIYRNDGSHGYEYFFGPTQVTQLTAKGFRPQIVSDPELVNMIQQNALRVGDLVVRGSNYYWSRATTTDYSYPNRLTLKFYFVTSTNPYQMSLITSDDITGRGDGELTKKGLEDFWPCKIR